MTRQDRKRTGHLSRLRSFFWPTGTGLSEWSLEERGRQARLIERARESARAARVTCDARLFEPSLAQYRQATFDLLAARRLHPYEDKAQLVNEFVETGSAGGLSPGMQDLLKSWLTENDPLPDFELKRRCELADALLDRLFDTPLPTTPLQARAQRFVRISTLLLVTAVSCAGYRAWLLFPKNLSSGKAVTASSLAPQKYVAGLVDDVYTGFPPFVSQREQSPWVQIDLGRVSLVTYARIVGRHDCCFDEALPLVLEVSEDGNTFTQVGEKKTPFVSLEPWVISSIMKRARYIRIRSTRRTVLALTEVTVYGRQR